MANLQMRSGGISDQGLGGDVPRIEVDKFVRSIGVNKTSPHALFLGAGSSMSSGVPSAESCLWQWKRSIFSTNNPGLEEQVSEISLPAVKNRIDKWLRLNGYLPDEGQDEYSYFIEECLPIADDRRRFFQTWVRRARPHIGYRLLCLLAESEIFRSVWTTNFDGLVARAAADSDLVPIEIGIDCKKRVFRQPERNELLCISLHGDYRYDSLKNTSEELRTQEAALQKSLISTLRTHSLIVNGYSGRDPSVMRALKQAIMQEDVRGKFYWCGFSDEPNDEVANLLTKATKEGKEIFYVPGVAFDDLMSRLALHCLEGAALASARRLLGGNSDSSNVRRSKFSIPQARPTAIIKSNAWSVRCPSEMFEFQLKEWPSEKVWRWLEERTAGHDVVAVPFRKVLALGTLDGVREAFGDQISGEIVRVPIAERDLRFEDGAVNCLLRRALIRSIAATKGLETDGNWRVWERQSTRTEREGNRSYQVHSAAHLALRKIGDQLYLTLDPTVFFPEEGPENADSIRKLRMRILGYQHNDKFNAALNYWRKLLLGKKGSVEFEFPVNSAAFKYTVRSAPAFAAVHQPGRKAVQLSNRFKGLIRHRGIEIPEQPLRFAGGDRPGRDSLPLRGLSQNGPFDGAPTQGSVFNRIKIGVICPKPEAVFLERFLSEASQRHAPLRGSKEEYLVLYGGFEQIYRTPISIPSRSDEFWYTLPEIASNLSDSEGSLELSRQIRDGVSALSSLGHSVILIHTPDRWRRWRGYESEDEVFDVHDFIKAFCIQRGIATQFLDEDTTRYTDKCRVWWWLSVAFYAKAMRTPWVLDGINSETAFVGLGYSIDRHAAKGQHVVLGCSHLYNAQGQGLQFRLSRIEDPIIKNGNPFLSYQDARRLGETIRTLFWESHLKLPRRVVIHKQTPFRKDEQLGLYAGLGGIEELELLELSFDASLRYISSQPTANGIVEGRFPVRRGTTVRLTDHEALLWIHGSAEAAKANWTYFQGKRRIPTPIMLRRYGGTSDLATLTSEILGLSKMDWNSGDLYAKLPATVQSSKRIARIGKLLDRFSNASYDYRLFM